MMPGMTPSSTGGVKSRSPLDREQIGDRRAGDLPGMVQEEARRRRRFRQPRAPQARVDIAQRLQPRSGRACIAGDRADDKPTGLPDRARRSMAWQMTTIVGAGRGARPEAASGDAARDRGAQDDVLASAPAPARRASPPARTAARSSAMPIAPAWLDQPREVALARKGLAVERDERVEHAVAEREAAVGWIDRAAERAVDPDWICASSRRSGRGRRRAGRSRARSARIRDGTARRRSGALRCRTAITSPSSLQAHGLELGDPPPARTRSANGSGRR